jgi:hypothetical protein
MSSEFDLTTSVSYLRDNNCNVAMEFTQDNEGYLLFNLRATPWRNSANAGMMILVGDYNVEQCLIRLAECVERRDWTPLNWRVRMDEPGIYTPNRQWAVLRNARKELEKAQEDRESPSEAKDTSKGPKSR